ncbi:MAG: hypothetical protein DI623_12490 [Sphingomonas sanxanigenens]|uniref:Uncharacterized protein n=1 Tax=Sphingomonas sanxanigenens TaxID=397260 RepID=A0A2W5A1V3_9SPHN|nr:MAG: hypothetical protein DI623_12490 [Sphingomonas sanxanigenens]
MSVIRRRHFGDHVPIREIARRTPLLPSASRARSKSAGVFGVKSSAKYLICDNDEPPSPALRHEIMDRFDSPPEPLDHLSYVVDYVGIPLLIAPPSRR